MTIHKSIYLQPEDPSATVFNVHTLYTGHEGGELLQEYAETVGSDTFGSKFRRRSPDHGETWSAPERCFLPFPTEAGMVREGEGALLRDPCTCFIYRFTNRHIYPEAEYTKEVLRRTTIEYQISDDGGRSFTDPIPLIVDGGSKEFWCPGVQYGVNSAMISFSVPIVDSQGRVILPAQWFPRVEESMETYLIPIEALCFIGERGEDGMRWRSSSPVSIDPRRSPRGIFEPAIAELEDGRMIMICRGSNGWDPTIDSRKWVAVSHDKGSTWSEPEAMAYDDGTLFYSPSSGSVLLRHSRSGRLFWLGNIIPHNASGNLPRHPLVIAEVDEESLALRKASVAVLDDADPDEDVRLSNFRAYEDRRSGDILVTLARSFGMEGCAATPAHQIRICL